jgi:hypothetical protein
MNDIEEFANESIPVTYCLEDAMSCPEYRDAMPIERLLSLYYFKQGNVRLGDLVSEVLRRHFTPPERFQRAILSDEQAKEILTALIKEGTIANSFHFVAVYRIFTDFCNFPKEITSFSHRIIELNLKLNGKLLEYSSLYQSIQKSINSHPVLPMSYKKWTEYKPEANERYNTFKRQKAVADALIKILRDRKILLLE